MEPRDTAFEGTILDIILFFATNEGMESFPDKESGILLPMAAALREYLLGDRGRIPVSRYHHFTDNWDIIVNREVTEALRHNSKGLSGKLLKTLADLLRIEWDHDMGESGWKSGLWRHLLFKQSSGVDARFLSVPEAQGVRRLIEEKRIDENTLGHCKEIGARMNKFFVWYRASG